jgi:hypothetical protein
MKIALFQNNKHANIDSLNKSSHDGFEIKKAEKGVVMKR